VIDRDHVHVAGDVARRRNDDVLGSVAVDVECCDGTVADFSSVVRCDRREGPVLVLNDVERAVRGDDEIEVAVAVEIGERVRGRRA
jgi:hypothetical protein